MTRVSIGPIRQLNQSNRPPIVVTTAAEMNRMARVERADGPIVGFQRPRIQAHIREFQDYLDHDDDPIRPNAIGIARRPQGLGAVR